jgi:hypothetical protein
MSEDRTRILGMLADGKITAAEAETLLDALGSASAVATAAPAPVASPSADWPTGPTPGAGTPKFMYVKIDGGEDKVDVKIPLALLRTGLKLTSLIPPAAMDEINKSMGEAGMSIDFSNLKPQDIEELIYSLGEMEVDVQAADGNHVRLFCA